MKKILMSVLLVLLIILTYWLVMKNVTIKIFNWTSKNVQNIKNLSNELDSTIASATQIKQQNYPASISKLEESINNLKKTKANYEAKTKYLEENVELGIVATKEYKIERLWITLGKYAKNENVTLKVDVVDTTTTDAEGLSLVQKYDLEVTVEGEYIGITDFIYDIENDDTLGFKILNFKLVPKTAETTNTSESAENSNSKNQTTTSTNSNTDKLTATFRIEGVGINFN